MSLPDMYNYKILFMRRDIQEILASQRAMLVRRGEDPDKVPDEEMAQLYDKHLKQVFAWMDAHSNITYMHMDYNQILQDPSPQAWTINRFLGGVLDVAAMCAAVDLSLYRQRR